MAPVDGLAQILAASSFFRLEGTYVYARVATPPSGRGHFLVANDGDEITVVTRSENVAGLDLLERNRDDDALIALDVSVPFYSVGFLAAVSAAIAARRMDVLVVSTYSKDYLLVRADLVGEAMVALDELGLTP